MFQVFSRFGGRFGIGGPVRELSSRALWRKLAEKRDGASSVSSLLPMSGGDGSGIGGRMGGTMCEAIGGGGGGGGGGAAAAGWGAGGGAM